MSKRIQEMKSVLSEIVSEVREKYIRQCGYKAKRKNEYFTGSCDEISKMVASELKKNGIDSERVHGVYGSRVKGINPSPHWWLIVDEFIIDAGVDQFEADPIFIRRSDDKRYKEDSLGED